VGLRGKPENSRQDAKAAKKNEIGDRSNQAFTAVAFSVVFDSCLLRVSMAFLASWRLI
jgi:hypothetical protein